MAPLKGLALFHFFILNQRPCCVDIPQLNRPHNISLISLCTFHSYLSEYFKVNTLILEMAGFLSRDFQPFCTHIYLLTFVDQTSLFQMLHGEIIKLWLTLGKICKKQIRLDYYVKFCQNHIFCLGTYQWRIQDFPYGGHQPHRGGDSRGGYISKILYVKTKESGPLGGEGVHWAGPLDPPKFI